MDVQGHHIWYKVQIMFDIVIMEVSYNLVKLKYKLFTKNQRLSGSLTQKVLIGTL